MTIFRCGQLYSAGRILRDVRLDVRDGTVSEITEWRDSDQPDVDLGPLAVVPAPVNAHLHSFQSILRGVADDLPLLAWRDALYRYTSEMTADDVELLALFAYSEAALRGTGTVCDFFYLHHGGNEFALTLADAARNRSFDDRLRRSARGIPRANRRGGSKLPRTPRRSPRQEAGQRIARPA
jgi:5-methylthioadenosine/S-adenosylhomocysteine deaminase